MEREMPNDSVIGNDTGVSGALTGTREFVAVQDMLVLNEGPTGRRAVNPPLLVDIVAKAHVSRAYVELIGMRPGEGAVGAFAFGRSRGVEGGLGRPGVTVTNIAPASWKWAVGLPAGREGVKDAARSEAIRSWPGQADSLARVRDDGGALPP
jgi:crossover junction endodeoxyribonuclease RuvC